ncbi:serine/threonine protein kinase [Candidatus Uabimicrobium amorphum]|uniref:Serine/threonine protein kinase n=1 Tax=Uabimicrobium amorphum TaxID=2596890 RepID=A0A5S9F1N4_UABAM|nr:serine/threonine-protein kinase [Candidatus Uabimicrobium amorphum]BBM82381.1 serine/threonine protein kinase [Candidatus Uabimicrobium amorphum]
MVQLFHNRYQPEKLIGRGGMGKVYLMMDTHTQRRVAIKECLTCEQDASLVERIKREYYFMTKIKHPHLVTGLDFFHLQGRYFIVMEYVEGFTISDFLQQYAHSISLEQQLQVAAQICSAVAALNENGIIHRDIKPENIILTPPGLTPKLLDFGVAKAVNGELVTITKTNNIVGTPAYMTPEQIDLRIEMCGNLDVFSLGVVFYQFFAWMPQSPFFSGQIVSTLDRIVHSELPPLFPETQDAQKRYVSQVIAWALRKNPRERIGSVQQLQELLCQRNVAQMNNIPQTHTSPKTFTPNLSTTSVKKNATFSYIRILLLVVANSAILLYLNYKAPISSKVNDKNEMTTYAKIEKSFAVPVTDYTPQLIEFYDKKSSSLYHQGMLLYRMREKNHAYKKKAIEIWQKDARNVMSQYQLFYTNMIELIITAENWQQLRIENLYQQSKQCISSLEKNRGKSPTYMKMLQMCRDLQEILDIITVYQKVSQRQQITEFFEQKLLGNGFGNLLLACRKETRLSKKLEFLHRALRMIPHEELLYVKLLEVYKEFEFYDKATFLYQYIQSNINPHLLRPDVEMLQVFMRQGKMDKARQMIEKLTPYKIFKNRDVQLPYCEYHFFAGNDNLALDILKDTSRHKLSEREKNFREGLRMAIHKKFENKPVMTILRATKLHVQKGNLELAEKQIRYVEDFIAKNKRSLKKMLLLRLQGLLYRVKLPLHSKQQKMIDVSIKKVPTLLGGSMSIVNTFRFAKKRNMDLSSQHVQLLKVRCDTYTFRFVYADYLFHNRKYKEAIIYWQKAKQAAPSFRRYFAEKQQEAWRQVNKIE